jgi:hypothetical protein
MKKEFLLSESQRPTSAAIQLLKHYKDQTMLERVVLLTTGTNLKYPGDGVCRTSTLPVRRSSFRGLVQTCFLSSSQRDCRNSKPREE